VKTRFIKGSGLSETFIRQIPRCYRFVERASKRVFRECSCAMCKRYGA
jgi:hypothetical protein